VLTAAAVLLLALAFQGSRGIWEPDEGFYTNVTLGMLHSGDWLLPRLNGAPFLDKPPLTYWGMAAGMVLLGENEWGARLFHALWFVIAAFAAGAAARCFWGPRSGRLASLVFATSLAPLVAGNILTPDMPLTAMGTLLFLFYVKAQGIGDRQAEAASPDRRWAWWIAAGAAAGLGLLAKGPALIVFAAPLAVHAVIGSTAARGDRRTAWAGLFTLGALAAGIGLSWYAVLFHSVPGAFRYVLDNQVTGRLLTATYARNAGAENSLLYYPPVLIAGALPWIFLWPWIGRAAARVILRGPREMTRFLAAPGPGPLLALATAIPLGILCFASSKLPLYALPLFVPLAILEARALEHLVETARAPWRRMLHPAAAALLVVALISAKGAGARITGDNDTRSLAHSLGAALAHITGPVKVISVDTKRNALPFYGFSNFLWVSSKTDPYPFFVEPTSLRDEVDEATRSVEGHAFLCTRRSGEKLARDLRERGMDCVTRPLTGDEVVLVCPPGHPLRASAS